jgi:microcystin-dependent protein
MDGRQVDAGKYPDLAALLGDTYGGDGVITVGLPDARGLVLRGADVAGLVSGSDTVTLETENLPAHTHSVDPPAHKHTIDPPATSTGNSTQSVQLRVRKGDNIEPEPNQLNGVSAWTNNNSSWAASAGGAGGTTDTSGQYISTSNHDHNVNIAAFDSAETDIPAFDSGSTGAGNAVDIVPKHLPVLVVMYAGTVVT